MSGPDGFNEHKIVVGIDGSDSAQAALRWAIQQSRQSGAEIEAVTAWRVPTAYGYPLAAAPLSNASELAERVLATALDQAAQLPGKAVPIAAKVIEGNAARVLLDEAKGAEMLVIGSRGHGGFVEALLGSTGQHCVQHASCPVVVVRDTAP